MLGGLARRRAASPALRLILLPDGLWSQYRGSCARFDESLHHSILLLAHERGYLDRILRPLERLLISGGAVRDEVPNQYRQDLRESWVLEDDPLERHHAARTFAGRIAELLLAAWIEGDGATLLALEAWGGRHDIEFADAAGHHCVCEAKYVGQEDEEFQGFLNLRRGESGGRWVGMYDALDFALIRVFEAALQLEGAAGRRIPCLVLSAAAEQLYRGMLEAPWIDWRVPQLYRECQTSGMEALLARMDHEYPSLDEELGPRLSAMDEVWIVGLSSDFVCRWIRRLRPGAPV